MNKTRGGARKGAGRPATGRKQVSVTVSEGLLKGMTGKEVKSAAEWAIKNGFRVK